MRRFRLFVLILSTSTIFASLPAVGAVKAGAACPRVGKVAIKSGNEFRCVKKGKKLVWVKSSKVVAAPSTPVANPTPSPTMPLPPTPSPTPSTTPQPSPTPTLTPSPTPTSSPSSQPTSNREGIDPSKLTLEEANRLRIPIDPLAEKPCERSGDRRPNSQGELVCMAQGAGPLKWSQNFFDPAQRAPTNQEKNQSNSQSETQTNRNVGANATRDPSTWLNVRAQISGGLCDEEDAVIFPANSNPLVCRKQTLTKLRWIPNPELKNVAAQSENANAVPGDTCFLRGRQQKSGAVNMECRYTGNYMLKWIEISGSNDAPRDALGLAATSMCKLRDQRSVIGGGGSTGFPMTHNRIQAGGVVDVAIIPIDFPDSVAPGKPSEYIREHLEMLDARNKYLYGDRIVYRWHLIDSWLRMPKEAKYFVYDHATVQADGSRVSDGKTQLLTDAEQATFVFSAAEKHIDVSNMDFFWVFSNPFEVNVQFGPYGSNQTVRTDTRTYSKLNYYPLGFMAYNGGWLTGGNGAIYDGMAHEMQHAHGMVQHAPGNGLGWYVSSNPTWEAWLAGWRQDSEFACVDATKSADLTISLSSMDLDSLGFKAITIKVSETELLVVESRRKGPFMAVFPKGLAGINVYSVDLTKAGDRWDGNKAREKDYYMYFLRNDRGNYPISNSNGTVLGDENILGYEGDTFTYKGIKISLAKSGDFDTVKVQK